MPTLDISETKKQKVEKLKNFLLFKVRAGIKDKAALTNFLLQHGTKADIDDAIQELKNEGKLTEK